MHESIAVREEGLWPSMSFARKESESLVRKPGSSPIQLETTPDSEKKELAVA